MTDIRHACVAERHRRLAAAASAIRSCCQAATIGHDRPRLRARAARTRLPLVVDRDHRRLGCLTGVLVGSILWLFYAGVGIWGIDWPVVWGFAIINYVWWIAIAVGGTFISALFYLTPVGVAHLDQPHRRDR